MLVKSKFGIIHVNNNTNNALITVSTIDKQTLFNGGAGLLNFKKSKRATGFAAQSLARYLSLKAFRIGIRFMYVYFKGFSKNRKAILKGILLGNLKILLIKDFTKISFNGCKQKKKRRK